MTRRKTISGGLLAVLLTTFLSLSVQASDSYNVRAVIPDNQINKRSTYFDLWISPGQKQVLTVDITNSGSEEMQANIAINSASTGRNGLIVYTVPGVTDESQAVTMEEIAQPRQNRVTIPAGDTRSVEIDLAMPEDLLEGVVLGGIVVSREYPELENSADQGLSVSNEISYVIGLKLTEDEGEPEQDFALTDIRADLVSYRPAVVFTLQNPTPSIVKEMEVDAQVYRRDGSQLLQSLHLGNAEMAPASSGDFAVDWQNQPLDRGDYVLHVTATHNDRTWRWEEPFSIGSEAGEINNNAIGLEKSRTWLYVLAVLLGLLLVGLIAYLLGRRSRRA